MSEWISIEDRLPENHQTVIYYFEDVGMCIGEYEQLHDSLYGTGNCFSSNAGFLTDDVTHWMPLPNIPE